MIWICPSLVFSHDVILSLDCWASVSVMSAIQYLLKCEAMKKCDYDQQPRLHFLIVNATAHSD